MQAQQLRLLNEFQRDFPLSARPFAAIGERIGMSEQAVIDALHAWQQQGLVSRVGAVFRPNTVGVSTLAAMAVPRERLAEVAQLVSGYSEVNHNYAREHRYNLWFVITAANRLRLRVVLDAIRNRARLPVLDLPLVEEYHIDLGFDLRANQAATAEVKVRRGAVEQSLPLEDISGAERALIAALQSGLPLTPRPYARIGEQAELREDEVTARIAAWLKAGVIRRLGVVVRHHELGYTTNAMVVWDVPDDQVAEVGRRLSQQDCVTLCYRRPRRLPDWPYNLFCMIHGQDRAVVQDQIKALRRQHGLEAVPCVVLFSQARFKQRGAHYVAAAGAA